MFIEIRWNGETTRVDLADGTCRVGGGPRDEIRIDGLPPSLVSLDLVADRLTVTASKSVRIGEALFPSHVPRLVVEGEEVQLPMDVVIARPGNPNRQQQRRDMGTAFVAKELLGNAVVPPSTTRAASLTCVTGPDVGTTWPLAFTDCTIGRAENVELRIHDRSVSRQHARLVRRGKDYLIEDLRTTNGVYLNGARLNGLKCVKTGDIVELGQTVLRFDGPERAPAEVTVIAPPTKTPPAPKSAAPAPAPAAPAPAPAQPRGGTQAAPVATHLPAMVSASVAELPLLAELPPELDLEAPRRLLSPEATMMGVGALMAVVGFVVTFVMLQS